MDSSDAPLSDITVLELGHIVAGPFCSLLLADLGAQVLKIEHPEHGDVFRRSQAEHGFNCYNRNKKGVTVDLKDDEGREVFLDLVRSADVVVENYSPGTVEQLDLQYDTLREVNPQLVYCSVKGFNKGPYADRPALDPVAEALGGLMSTTGYPEHPPARCGTSVADMTASLHGALAVAAALRHRDRTGEGQHITSPMFEGVISLMGSGISYSDATGKPREPWGGGGQGQWAPYGTYETHDERWVFIGPSSQAHWENLCKALGLDELRTDDRFRTLPDRRAHSDELDRELGAVFAELDRDELIERLIDEDVPAAPINNTLEVLDDHHLDAVDALPEITTIEDTELRVPGNPIRSTGFDVLPATDPPRQGEDTDAVLQSIGYQPEDIDALRERGVI